MMYTWIEPGVPQESAVPDTTDNRTECKQVLIDGSYKESETVFEETADYAPIPSDITVLTDVSDETGNSNTDQITTIHGCSLEEYYDTEWFSVDDEKSHNDQEYCISLIEKLEEELISALCSAQVNLCQEESSTVQWSVSSPVEATLFNKLQLSDVESWAQHLLKPNQVSSTTELCLNSETTHTADWERNDAVLFDYLQYTLSETRSSQTVNTPSQCTVPVIQGEHAVDGITFYEAGTIPIILDEQAAMLVEEESLLSGRDEKSSPIIGTSKHLDLEEWSVLDDTDFTWPCPVVVVFTQETSIPKSASCVENKPSICGLPNEIQIDWYRTDDEVTVNFSTNLQSETPYDLHTEPSVDIASTFCIGDTSNHIQWNVSADFLVLDYPPEVEASERDVPSILRAQQTKTDTSYLMGEIESVEWSTATDFEDLSQNVNNDIADSELEFNYDMKTVPVVGIEQETESVDEWDTMDELDTSMPLPVGIICNVELRDEWNAPAFINGVVVYSEHVEDNIEWCHTCNISDIIIDNTNETMTDTILYRGSRHTPCYLCCYTVSVSEELENKYELLSDTYQCPVDPTELATTGNIGPALMSADNIWCSHNTGDVSWFNAADIGSIVDDKVHPVIEVTEISNNITVCSDITHGTTDERLIDTDWEATDELNMTVTRDAVTLLKEMTRSFEVARSSRVYVQGVPDFCTLVWSTAVDLPDTFIYQLYTDTLPPIITKPVLDSPCVEGIPQQIESDFHWEKAVPFHLSINETELQESIVDYDIGLQDKPDECQHLITTGSVSVGVINWEESRTLPITLVPGIADLTNIQSRLELIVSSEKHIQHGESISAEITSDLWDFIDDEFSKPHQFHLTRTLKEPDIEINLNTISSYPSTCYGAEQTIPWISVEPMKTSFSPVVASVSPIQPPGQMSECPSIEHTTVHCCPDRNFGGVFEKVEVLYTSTPSAMIADRVPELDPIELDPPQQVLTVRGRGEGCYIELDQSDEIDCVYQLCYINEMQVNTPDIATSNTVQTHIAGQQGPVNLSEEDITATTEDSTTLSTQTEPTLIQPTTDTDPTTYQKPPYKPVFVKTMTAFVAMVGEDAKFECVVQGNPAPTITWVKGGVSLQAASDHYSTDSDNESVRLIVHDAHLADSGEYRCIAINSVGYASSVANLHVMEAVMPDSTETPLRRTSSPDPTTAPVFIQRIPNIIAVLGKPARFNCIVIGNPKPNIIWYQDGKVIPPSDSHYSLSYTSDGVCSLRIKKVEHSDRGVYTCKAINQGGSVTASATLTLNQ